MSLANGLQVTRSSDAEDGSGVTTVMIVQSEQMVGPELRWPLRCAKVAAGNIVLLIAARGTASRTSTRLDWAALDELDPYQRTLAEKLRTVLDQYLGPDQWLPEPRAESATEADASIPTPLVEVWLLGPEFMMERLKQLIQSSRSGQVLFVNSNDAEFEEERTLLGQAALRSLACPMAEIVPGARQEEGQIRVLAGHSPHGRAAIQLAARLAADAERRLTAVYVEADVGPDADDVGRRVLDKRLRSAGLDVERAHVNQRVVVNDNVISGIVEVSREDAVEVVVLGAERFGAMGERRPKSMRKRLLAAKPRATVITVRSALPMRSQLLLWLLAQVRQRVPQLERESRVALVERIQSGSEWNFDFIVLLGLATMIASLGLLQSSPAIIIGAMLVAPLMTPLLGLGLAISQGNPRLARMAGTTAVLGFIAVFGLALFTGLVATNFHTATEEMQARHWPQVSDLLVAFVSGMAAAYAYGRPSLLAALPGVAIATSLVPPVATSALAVAIADFDVALGAMLLFAVNALAIVVATGTTLHAMGVRQFAKSTALTRWLGRVLLALTAATAIVLMLAPPRRAPPEEMRQSVVQALDGNYQLRDIRLRSEHGRLTVHLDVSGAEFPPDNLQTQLRQIVADQLGKDVPLRLSYQYELLVP